MEIMNRIKYGIAARVISDEEFNNFLANATHEEINIIWSDINRAIRSDDAFANEEERNVWKRRLNVVNRVMDKIDEAELEAYEENPELFHSER